MALPVLDGNQSATTLSSVVTGGEHIVAHSVVCFGSTAISNITNAVSGSVVSISNLPSTQTIAGTVTANAGNFGFEPYEDLSISGKKGIIVGFEDDGSGEYRRVKDNQPLPVTLNAGGAIPNIVATVTVGNSVTIGSLPAISGTVTVGAIGGSVTIPVRLFAEAEGGPSSGQDTLVVCDSIGQLLINAKAGGASVLGYDGNAFVSVKQVAGSSVTIGSLPAISGTVTVANNNFNIKAITVGDGSNFFYITNAANYRIFSPTGSSKTLNNIFGATPSWIVAFSDSVTWVSDSGTEVAYFHDGTQWTLDDLTTPAGTLALNGSVFITNVSGVSGINILNGFTATQLGSPLVDSGATRVQIYSSTVTAAAPNGSLTTRFGTPTTANVSFATSAVTNASRKYLLIQNITTGSNVITVGIGFTPTTTQGIQLTAGAGITFESSYIPTGAVRILSSVTASNFTILEA